MSISANSYGSVTGVQAYIRHMTLDAANNPTTAQIEDFIDQQSAKLNGWLAAAGYSIPVVQSDARRVLDNFANIGAAGLAELSQRTGGYGQAGQVDKNARESQFLAEFAKAEAYINSQALQQLGAAHTDTTEAPSALSFVPATYGAAATDEYARPPDYWP